MALVNVGLSDLVKPIAGLVEHFFPDPQERAQAQTMLDRIAQAPAQAQVQVDLAEAKSGSVFVAGGRAFLLWITGCCVAAQYIVAPYLLLPMAAHYGYAVPAIDYAPLYRLALWLLGASHTAELGHHWIGAHYGRGE